jgi:hypothetical protein
MSALVQLVTQCPTESPEETALEEAILAGFINRHLSANHRRETIEQEIREYREFRRFVGRPPWRWRNADMDRFGADLRRQNRAATRRHRRGEHRRLFKSLDRSDLSMPA